LSGKGYYVCQELYQIAINHWNPDTIDMQEELKLILMNKANHVIGIYELSKGGVSFSIVDIKLLMSVALKCLASGVALIHNHPSGAMIASEADIRITQKVKSACELLEIALLDHLIISKDEYYSFADSGKL
jgi:DNA repair protein RadC